MPVKFEFNSAEITEIKGLLRVSPIFQENGLRVERFGGVPFVYPEATGKETLFISRDALGNLIKNLNAPYEKACFLVGDSKESATSLTECFPIIDNAAKRSSCNLFISQDAYLLQLERIKSEIGLHNSITIVDVHSHPSTIDMLLDADSWQRRNFLETVPLGDILRTDKNLQLGYGPRHPDEFSQGDEMHALYTAQIARKLQFSRYLFGIVRFYDLIEGDAEKRFARLLICEQQAVIKTKLIDFAIVNKQE